MTASEIEFMDAVPGWSWSGRQQGGVFGPKTSPEAQAARLPIILAMADAGATYDATGVTVGLSSGRVGTIVRKHRALEDRPMMHRVAVQRLVDVPAPTPSEVAAEIRASLLGSAPEWGTAVRLLLDQFDPSPTIALHSMAPRQRSLAEWETEWADRLQRAAQTLGDPLSQSAFERWAFKNGEPASQAMRLRGYTWPQVCEIAGIKPAHTSMTGPRDTRVWTVERCHEALDEFVEWALLDGQWPTYAAYEQWTKTRKAPSRTTVRIRLGDFGAELNGRAWPLLSAHFVDALTRLDAGEQVDPATYVGPLNAHRFQADNTGARLTA